MDAATAETAGAFGKQGLMAVGMATANAALPEVAASLSNRLKGTNVELKCPGELAGEIAQGAAGQFLVGGGAVGAHEALRSMVQTHIENAVSAAADRELAKQAQEARFEEAVKASAEKAKAAEVPEHPIEAATREMQAKQTIGDIVDREPQLPEVKPAEDPYAAQLEAETAKKTTVSDEQLKAMLDKAKEAHGEDIKMPGVTKDWHDAVRMDPNDEGKAVLWYNDAEGGTHAIVEPLEAKATERPSTGNGRRDDYRTRNPSGHPCYERRTGPRARRGDAHRGGERRLHRAPARRASPQQENLGPPTGG